ncbi:restriction endonuclease subunit S [Bacteroides sedimenti]|uniref:Type I restriction modification DNA specificity domain-containing protein n=1 Tax=Bacteroides sedimenti TaxID=2136147 RepID=A0ABN6Z354_9BACE
MEKKTNVPKLRFPEFEGEWVEKKLGTIYNFKTTNSFTRDNLNYEEGVVKNIHYGDIHKKFKSHFDITKELVPFVNKEISLNKLSAENYCKEGDIIIADASEDYVDIGKSIEIVNLNNEKIIAGLHTLHASPDLQMLAIGFGAHVMKSENIRLQIKTVAQGTKVLSITSDRLSNIILIIPTLPEQTKIASFLTAVDDKLTQLKKKKSLLEEYKKGVMQKIFSQELRFKDDNGEYFPEWEEKRLGDITERIVSKNKENNLNVLTISAQNGLISQLEFFNKSVSAKDVTGYYLLNKDDFAYNKSYSNGYPMGAIKRLTRYEKGIVSTLYICFRNKPEFDNSFAEQYFETGLQNSELEKVAQEGARNHGLLNIGVSDFFNIELSIPSLPEQTKIANFLSAIDEKINHFSKQIERMEEWEKGLLQQMFC